MPAARHNGEGWLARERVHAIGFGAIAAVLAYLCWLLVEPLFAPITCALALAVVTRPAYAWLAGRLGNKSLAAALAMLLVTVTIVVPATLAGRQVAQEAVAAATKVKASVEDGSWRGVIARNPNAAAAMEWIDGAVDLQYQLAGLSEHVPGAVKKVMSGSLQFAVGVGVTLFLLFFFLRDREQMLGALRGLLPLSEDEAGKAFRQVEDTIFAIIYGTLAVSLVQGALGGLMFWWLNLHAPILWGSAMAVMAIVPLVGTAIVWGPAVIFLFLDGSPEKAFLLAMWGFIVIGLIDNLLKPALVRDRMRMHIVPVFVSILGGLAAFGAAGVIIGPVVFALALALIEIWRRRVRDEPSRRPAAAGPAGR